jgi:predicted TPR repeat methyltransferase
VPPRTARTRLNRAFRTYLEHGTLEAAARAIDVHPKTLQRAARRENWQARAAAIHAAAAQKSNGLLTDSQAQARATARLHWTEALTSAQTTEAVLAALRLLLP